MSSRFKGQHILSIKQFSNEGLKEIFDLARTMQSLLESKIPSNLLQGKVVATLFYEPSTRTSSSFLSAAQRLGGGIIPINGVQYSSVTKGETPEDTLRTLSQYADAIVMRHPEKGQVAQAAAASEVPVINAGDGVGEHPTQALLDAFTILKEKKQLSNINVVMIGDLKYGRTIHSLARLVTQLRARPCFYAPEALALPEEIRKELDEQTTPIFYESIEDAVEGADVLYVTRVQKERFPSEEEYRTVAGSYVITPELMMLAKPDMVLMHPFPRVDEISHEVDEDPRAAYFRQMRYGLAVRMALLALVLGRAE
jgi:aspartate carbamoyltransferase